MKKTSTLLVAAIVIFSSCQKTDAYLNGDAQGKIDDAKKKTTGKLKKCSIQQIMYPVGGGTNDVLQFTYNSSGDPVNLTRTLGAHTGYPNYVFKYDQKSRLADFIGVYEGNATAEFWHKYFYNSHGNIALDSTYIFPTISNGFPENAFDRRLTFYYYDGQDRIIKDSTVSAHGAPIVNTYAYNANGNKTGRTYDVNVNINRTHNLWMFLNRDYSVNNPFNADSYNASGLPSGFNLPEENAFGFLGNVYATAQLVYTCDSQSTQ